MLVNRTSRGGTDGAIWLSGPHRLAGAIRSLVAHTRRKPTT